MEVRWMQKKPISVPTIVYDGTNRGEIDIFGAQTKIEDSDLWLFNAKEACWVRCPVGYSVVKGVAGEFYPIDPQVMLDFYDPLPGPPAELEEI